MIIKKINGALAFLLTEKELEKVSILLNHQSTLFTEKAKEKAVTGSRLPGDRFFKYAKHTEEAITGAERTYGVGNWVFLSDPDFRKAWEAKCSVKPGVVLADQAERGYVELVKSEDSRIVKFKFLKK